MLIRITEDRCGNILIRPVSAKKASAIRDYLRSWGQRGRADLFYNQGGEAESVLEALDIPADRMRSLRNGYSITIRADNFTVANLYGWDMCEANIL